MGALASSLRNFWRSKPAGSWTSRRGLLRSFDLPWTVESGAQKTTLFFLIPATETTLYSNLHVLSVAGDFHSVYFESWIFPKGTSNQNDRVGAQITLLTPHPYENHFTVAKTNFLYREVRYPPKAKELIYWLCQSQYLGWGGWLFFIKEFAVSVL